MLDLKITRTTPKYINGPNQEKYKYECDETIVKQARQERNLKVTQA